MRYWKFGGRISKVFVVVMFCCLIPITTNYIVPIFDDSLLLERSQKSLDDDARTLLIKETIDIGLHNPIVGIGPGCVKLYTTERGFAHNTYLELFAGTGLVGVIIYIVLLWKFVSTQIRRYMTTKDKIYMYFLIFGVFFVIDQMFYVFYYSIYLISFIILVASHSDTCYNNRTYVSDSRLYKK